MVIDFHTHIFPDKIAKKTIEHLELNIKNVFGEDSRAVIEATLDGLEASMQENGVDYSVVLPIATKPTQSDTINNFAAEVNRHERIFSFGSLHPMQEDWEDTLYKIKELGLLGIKLHPEYQQCRVDEKETIRILEKCEELDLYTVFHAGKDIGMPPPVHCEPYMLKNVLNYVKGDKIIAAHLGAWKMWDEVEEQLVGTEIIFDTAFIKNFIDREQLLRIIKNHGSKKILFATDSPWESQGEDVRFFEGLPISKEDKENIMFKNAKKLLNLS